MSAPGGHKRNSGWGSMSVTPSVAVVDEDEDDEWRHGDGGSTPSFRAIFLATRILTPDPASLLVDSARINASSSIARLAHTLVSNARDAHVVPREPPTAKREHARSRAASVASQQAAAASGTGYSDQAIAATVAVGRTLLSRSKAAISGGSKVEEPMARPTLVHRATSRPFPTTAMAPALQGSGELGLPAHSDTPPPSVELGTIVPDEDRPPTVLLSRQNLASFFQSSRVGAPKLATATRFTSDQPPLTDRYGFIYDIQHANMLKDASRAGTPAPISLTGHVPETPAGRSTTAPAAPANAARLSTTRSNSTSSKSTSTSLKPPAVRSDSSSSLSRESVPGSPRSHTPETTPNGTPRKRTTALQRSLAPAPSKPTSAKDQTTVSVRGASSLQTGVSASALSHPATPIAEPSASRLTVSSLLDQLTDIHDKQQKARTAEWDAFLRKKTRRGNGVQDVGVGAALAAVINMGHGAGGKAGQEEYRAFLRLVRRGIPIPYRADVWAECSGARDLLVPGEYAEILAVHKDDKSPVIAEIEKDVGRTFPGNVFFGGDGPGVAKLRRVLTAYSWHNPAVGYCQGMNMLAATLLLTHTDEEQAFWVLHSIIERLLPQDYYTPTLLGSRADQRALAGLVAQHVPRVAAHLDKLQVDLASVTFGWFLSLFTDCLPVETLFRVWDVFFVEGHDVLFRVAIAILKINETDLLACDSVGDLFTFISGMTSRLWGADKLIALQHSYKSVIRHADIQALYDRAVGDLQRELGED
ncbi:hypothetical protein VHUM_02283 [Vanrija humicola]|uniref:Rab-GAP TBC domain-containing protein n=1 Tax=Vanrija humicola TaxID=5417 RepID=A0A7D8YWU0_VANHU|nr:hypothetical protein VHUM_02283 [Vanrija humicola]